MIKFYFISLWSYFSLFSFASPSFSFPYRQLGVKPVTLASVVLLRYSTQYLVDLQDFSPLLGGRAALGGRAILVSWAVVLHKGYQQLEGTENKKKSGNIIYCKQDNCKRITSKNENDDIFNWFRLLWSIQYTQKSTVSCSSLLLLYPWFKYTKTTELHCHIFPIYYFKLCMYGHAWPECYPILKISQCRLIIPWIGQNGDSV